MGMTQPHLHEISPEPPLLFFHFPVAFLGSALWALLWIGKAWLGVSWPGLAWFRLAWLCLAKLGFAWRALTHIGVLCCSPGPGRDTDPVCCSLFFFLLFLVLCIL